MQDRFFVNLCDDLRCSSGCFLRFLYDNRTIRFLNRSYNRIDIKRNKRTKVDDFSFHACFSRALQRLSRMCEPSSRK